MIRTVVAVTAPLLAAGPKALTQSPTARSVEAAVCVELTVVELDVVIVSFSVLGVVGLLVVPVLFVLRAAEAAPGPELMPVTLTLEP